MEENNVKNVNEKVDILLATYNTNVTYLTLQIDSILNQSYKNINLIISDDNSSSKEVLDILDKYKVQDNRIILFKQEKNLGYLKNFEFLLSKSTAEYIAYADHDDIWYENKIEKCVDVIKNKNVDLVYSDCKQIDENGKIINESYLKHKNMPVISGKNNILCFSRHIAIGCSMMFTKKIKDQMLPFKDSVMAHDWVNMYLASKQDGVFCINEQLFEYRLHGSNEFGGRSLKQNLARWKKDNGISYKAYKKYRNERVIKTAYLDGAIMCKEYREKLNLKKQENEDEVIKYYEKLLKTKVLNIQFNKYNKYLSYKEIGKRRLKEVMMFHFPIISYLVYLVK